MATSHAQPMLLLLLSLFFLPTLRAIPYEDCVPEGSPIEVTGVDIYGDAEKASFKITGSTSTRLTGGIMNVKIKVGLIKLLDRQYDPCQFMKCPVAPGAFELPFTKLFPPNSPVKYSVHLDIFDESEEQEIMCLNFRFMTLSSATVFA